jgi:hypothetical protein
MNASLGALVCLSMGLAFAKFASPVNAPVDRLTRNIEAFVQAHPEDARGHYMLARLHYLAFALRTDTVAHFPGEPPQIGSRFNPGKPVGDPVGKISDAEALQHLIAASAEIRTALLLESNALTHLTSACILEDGAPLAPQVKRGDTPGQWIEQAITQYRRAHDLAWRDDSKLEAQPLSGFQSLVGYEAGLSYVRLVKARGLRADERKAVELIDQHVATLKNLPLRGITPIVLQLSSRASITDLLDPTVEAAFDLDGTGRVQKWPWLRADTGVLVWDPERTGIITSGRQLFGSVTWWMFWQNGYDALAALDDDGDGWLTGSEIKGLSVWFDRNQNGRSDPGEVVPVEQVGIEAIRVRADSREGSSWKSSQGIRMRDGSFLPTWDWVVGTR